MINMTNDIENYCSKIRNILLCEQCKIFKMCTHNLDYECIETYNFFVINITKYSRKLYNRKMYDNY